MDAVAVAAILAAGAGTAVGGLFLLVLPRPSELVLSVLLGFTAGVMLATLALMGGFALMLGLDNAF